MIETLLTSLGAVSALTLAALGSIFGTKKAAIAGVVASAEDSENKTPSLILSALPTTQTIYAFVIIFMIFIPSLAAKITLDKAIKLFLLGVSYGIIGLLSAYVQGLVASAGIQMLSKSKDYVQYLILASLVEFFALIAFITTILMA